MTRTIWKYDVYGTGWPLTDEKQRYVGSIAMRSGFVWHVYEVVLNAPEEAGS